MSWNFRKTSFSCARSTCLVFRFSLERVLRFYLSYGALSNPFNLLLCIWFVKFSLASVKFFHGWVRLFRVARSYCWQGRVVSYVWFRWMFVAFEIISSDVMHWQFWYGINTQSLSVAFGSRGNYDPKPSILKGSLYPAVHTYVPYVSWIDDDDEMRNHLLMPLFDMTTSNLRRNCHFNVQYLKNGRNNINETQLRKAKKLGFS